MGRGDVRKWLERLCYREYDLQQLEGTCQRLAEDLRRHRALKSLWNELDFGDTLSAAVKVRIGRIIFVKEEALSQLRDRIVELQEPELLRRAQELEDEAIDIIRRVQIHGAQQARLEEVAARERPSPPPLAGTPSPPPPPPPPPPRPPRLLEE